MSEEARKVWRAKLSLARERKLGYLTCKSGRGNGWCRNHEQWCQSGTYSTRTWTLFVTDCPDCGPTFRAVQFGGSTKKASEKREWLYGNRAEVVRAETETLFAVAV